MSGIWIGSFYDRYIRWASSRWYSYDLKSSVWADAAKRKRRLSCFGWEYGSDNPKKQENSNSIISLQDFR